MYAADAYEIKTKVSLQLLRQLKTAKRKLNVSASFPKPLFINVTRTQLIKLVNYVYQLKTLIASINWFRIRGHLRVANCFGHGSIHVSAKQSEINLRVIQSTINKRRQVVADYPNLERVNSVGSPWVKRLLLIIMTNLRFRGPYQASSHWQNQAARDLAVPSEHCSSCKVFWCPNSLHPRVELERQSKFRSRSCRRSMIDLFCHESQAAWMHLRGLIVLTTRFDCVKLKFSQQIPVNEIHFDVSREEFSADFV